MLSKKKLLQNCRLYLILDTQVADYDALFDIAKKAIRGGVDIIQLRDKNGLAKDIIWFSDKIIRFTKHKIPYIINDHLGLVLVTECDGIHLGQDDIPIEKARKILGHRRIIGASCQTEAHCIKAYQDGADYIGFGSVFKTKTKPNRALMDLELLKKILQRARVPVFPIGGIDETNVKFLKDLGAERFAVCRAICEAKNAFKAARFFKK